MLDSKSSDTSEIVMEIAFGRWKSQTLYAGVNLGVFDNLSLTEATSAAVCAEKIVADAELLYRLMRALSALGVLSENAEGEFALTDAGQRLREDDPDSLRYMVLLEEGPEHYAIWKHLSDMVKDGTQNAFLREYDSMAFDYAHQNPEYGEVFRKAMSSFSTVQSLLVREALSTYNFSKFNEICDVAGGQGHLLCSLLQEHDYLTGKVLDLPNVVEDHANLWAPQLGLENRCKYIAGDMFKEIPTADVYLLKMILHDWNDEECIEILANIRKSVSAGGRVLIAEHIVPGTSQPHFSKFYDIHMMCWGGGRERTPLEYSNLLEKAGWTPGESYYPPNKLMGVVEGVAA